MIFFGYFLDYKFNYYFRSMRSELQMEHTSTYIHTQPKYDVVEWVIKRRSNKNNNNHNVHSVNGS